MAKVICIASGSSTRTQRMEALQYFLGLGFINVAIVHEASSRDVYYEIVQSLARTVGTLKNPAEAVAVFPDKLRNLEGFHYKLPIYFQPTVFAIKNKKIYSPMMFFLNAVGTAQNAKFNITFLRNISDFDHLWKNRQMHLSINTAKVMLYPDPKVQTYDKKSYCALVPIPQKASYFSVIIVKPFDALIWVFFGMSIVGSVAVWRMYRDHGAVDSHWQLAAGIFTMFIGQGAEFSRRNRFVLAVLLNIICLSVFLLSNLYEGAITSFMIEPAHDNRIKSVDDLLNTNYKFISNPIFEYTIKNSSLIQRMSSRLNSSGLVMGAEGGKYVIEQRYVFIRTCDEVKLGLNYKLSNGQFVKNYYYQLPEELSWQYIQLEASYLNPFVERLQYYLDLCFQAGLPQMWRVMASQDYSEFINTQSTDERDYLELQDIGSFFWVLIIGLGLSGLALLIEIFYHDCITNVNFRSCSRGWFRNLFQKRQRKNKLKVRKILVRPAHRL